MTMGQRILQARLAAGLSQRELAGEEITRNMLSSLEHDAATPSIATLRYLARRLGRPVSYFLGEDDSSEGVAAFESGAWRKSLELMTQADRKMKEILDFARGLIRYDVLSEPVPEGKLCGMTEQELRQRSHFPQEYYGTAHFMPAADHGEPMARLNRGRCAAREAELAAIKAFSDREGNPTRPDILRALNRMSSMLYILMIQIKCL